MRVRYTILPIISFLHPGHLHGPRPINECGAHIPDIPDESRFEIAESIRGTSPAINHSVAACRKIRVPPLRRPLCDP